MGILSCTASICAIVAGANIYREGLNGKYGDAPKRYKHYKDLIKANDVDAVIIESEPKYINDLKC